jgi:beta-mannosidase
VRTVASQQQQLPRGAVAAPRAGCDATISGATSVQAAAVLGRYRQPRRGCLARAARHQNNMRPWLLAAAAAAVGWCAALAGEAPIAGTGAVLALDGLAWSAVSSSGLRVPAQVPGDLLSDLARAGVIADPWKDLTWRQQAGLWDTHSWNFTVSFHTPAAWASSGATLLVFDSVKMAGDITLNGAALGAATSQHLRYVYDVSQLLLAPPPSSSSRTAANSLTVAFPPTVSDTRNDFGRFQGCSGGWDWAPYSNETTGRTPKGLPTMSKGLVSSVYLTHVKPTHAFITAVKPLVSYLGSYPTEPLTDATAGGWRVDVVVYLLAPPAAASTATAMDGGTLQVTSAWGSEMLVPVSGLVVGVEKAVNVSLAVEPGTVRLWWPNTVVSSSSSIRPLYSINISFAPAGALEPVVMASSRVGFRTLALVTADDSEPDKLAGVPGSGALTMRIKINGADLSARGANWIPLEELNARASDAAHVAAVASAAAAGMSILRIWGGGIYPCEALLAAADAAGVLLYVDAMYASQGDSHHFATDTAEQRAELMYNVRRMAPHPCVAIYDGAHTGNQPPFDTATVYGVATCFTCLNANVLVRLWVLQRAMSVAARAR